ncbi:MAG: hypothetical protein IJW92_08050 [Clostridia bacterium]|nr:hypothetical protein [Clostridia bacterium]
MKSKRIRLAAKLILWIGVIAGLLGCVLALLLAMGNPLGIPTDYVPQTLDFIIVAAGLVVVILVSIILHAVANGCEKREQIRACFEAAEAESVVEEEVAEEPVEEAVEEVAETEVEAVEEAPKTKLQIVRAKVMEKTHMTEEQMQKAEKIAKVAVPVGAACIVVGMALKLKGYRKQARMRQTFYKWLG